MNDDDGLSRRGFMQASAATFLASQTALAQAEKKKELTAAAYIVERLAQLGVEHLFGVPGATCDPFFAAAEKRLDVVVTSSDLEAGYAADGYARVRGLSCVSVSYGVGTTSLLCAIGGAYAERSPVVVVNGGPSDKDLRLQSELGVAYSHSVGRGAADVELLRPVCAYVGRADSAANIASVVDTALRVALIEQRPVCIEIAKHAWDVKVPFPKAPLETTVPIGDIPDVRARVQQAKQPLLLLGIEVARLKLSSTLAPAIAKSGLPWATTLLSKACIPEDTPGFVGVYGGRHAIASVKNVVENSDCVVALGCMWGRQHRELIESLAQKKQLVSVHGPAIVPVVEQLQKQKEASAASSPAPSFAARRAGLSKRSKPEQGLTYDDVMGAVSDFLDDTFITITDTSLSMYPAAELAVRGAGSFMSNAIWQAIGFSPAAAVGVGIAGPRRPLVVCGDGGFQMTATALSTMARWNLRGVVIVLDNGVYGIEQWLLQPQYFHDPAKAPKPYLGLSRWRYADLAKSLGVARASVVDDVKALQRGLAEAKAADGPVFFSCSMAPHDLPAGLS